MKRVLPLLVGGLLLVSFAPAAVTHAARLRGGGGAPAPGSGSITVLVGVGQPNVSPGSGLLFAPKYVDITVGQTVVWRDIDQLEPHTVSFGPASLLNKLVQSGGITPVPQKNGPPQLVFDPKVAFPTPGTTYDGTGYANSGFLYPALGRTSWSLTFTRPGVYHYLCIIHGQAMAGVVIVHAQPPQQGRTFMVQAGDSPLSFNDRTNNTTNDSFYPRQLTIHAGDTVEWIGGFHTVSFGPEALLRQLEQNFVIAMPQQSGPPKLVLNPQVAYPSGGSTYNGTGFVSSGLLFLRVPPGSNAPPTYKLTFTTPGTYTYDCLVHAGMDGTITVMP
jgi:plastocyanin